MVTWSWLYYPFAFWLFFTVVVLKVFEKIFSFLIHLCSFLLRDTSRHNLWWTLSRFPALHQRPCTHSSITFLRITCSVRNRLFLAEWVVRKTSFCCAFSWYNSASLSLCTLLHCLGEKTILCISLEEQAMARSNGLILVPLAFLPLAFFFLQNFPQ